MSDPAAPTPSTPSFADIVAQSGPFDPNATPATPTVELMGRAFSSDQPDRFVFALTPGVDGIERVVEANVADVVSHETVFEDSSGRKTLKVRLPPDAPMKMQVTAAQLALPPSPPQPKPQDPSKTDPHPKSDPIKVQDPIKQHDPAPKHDPVKQHDPIKGDPTPKHDPVKQHDPIKGDPTPKNDPVKQFDPVKGDPAPKNDPAPKHDPVKQFDPISPKHDPAPKHDPVKQFDPISPKHDPVKQGDPIKTDPIPKNDPGGPNPGINPGPVQTSEQMAPFSLASWTTTQG